MAQPGDKVKISTDKEILEGILMPVPDYAKKETVILKLKNGYNVGLAKKKINNIKLISKYSGKTDKTSPIKHNPKLPTVSILSTGGTISSKVDYRTGGVYADYTAQDLVEMCPELKKIANIRAKKVMSLMSEDMVPNDWIDLSKHIVKDINSGVDGVVVTQGTDTMHFTTAATSFLLENIDVPVVFTASQRSIDRGSSDAFMNLICSVKAAAEFNAAEVMTCMHGSINDDYCLLIRGTKVRKMHTSRRDAFRPINDLPFAKVTTEKIEPINSNYKKAKRKGKATYNQKFEEKIALITVYPNMDNEIIDFYLKKNYKGIILAATALGHVPTWSEKSLIPNISKAIKKGVPVFIASQTLYGRVNPYVYSNLRKLSIEAKAIYLEDILPETAYIKLGWVLGQENDIKKVNKMMTENIRGEFNNRLTPNMFLY